MVVILTAQPTLLREDRGCDAVNGQIGRKRRGVMKRLIAVAVLAICLSFGSIDAHGFTLTSDDLGIQLSQAQVYSGFGCTGSNISPVLKWTKAPANTKSFVVTVYDPDAPTGHGWWHWIIFNIPGDTTGLKADAGNPSKKLAPPGSVQSMTDFGKPGFGGACPPRGDKPHRYIFTVYALSMPKLEFDETASPATIESALNRNILGKASLTSHYGRK